MWRKFALHTRSLPAVAVTTIASARHSVPNPMPSSLKQKGRAMTPAPKMVLAKAPAAPTRVSPPSFRPASACVPGSSGSSSPGVPPPPLLPGARPLRLARFGGEGVLLDFRGAIPGPAAAATLATQARAGGRRRVVSLQRLTPTIIHLGHLTAQWGRWGRGGRGEGVGRGVCRS